MRVGIVTEWFERGSAYVSKVFADQLQEQGAEVFIYTRAEHYRKGQPAWGGSNVHFGKYAGYPVAKSIHKGDFLKWLSNSKLDVVIFNEQQWIDPVLWAKSEGVHTVGYVDFYTPKTLKDFRHYDGLVCNTERHLSAMNWHSNALFIPWGLDLNVFAPKEEGTERKTNFFHSFGWDPYRKGTDLLIKAFERISDYYRLTIHGQRDLLEVFPELTDLVQTLEVQGRLRIVTQTVGAPGLYGLGEIYVYPSRLEGIGLSVPEALAMGLPLVTTDEPPMSEFAEAPHSRKVRVASRKVRADGYFWPESEVDVSHLAESMKSLATEYQDRGIEMQRDVRRWSRQRLDAEKNFLPLRAFLETTTKLELKTPRLLQHLAMKLKMVSLAPLGLIWRNVVKIHLSQRGKI